MAKRPGEADRLYMKALGIPRMTAPALMPKGPHAWLGLLLRVGLLLLLVFGGLMFFTKMPGRSHQGPPPPPTREELALAERLRRHVTAIAEHIGERNLWHYPALNAAAQYIEDQLTGLGLQPRRQTYTVQGREVSNLEVEVTGKDPVEEVVVIGAHYDSVLGSPGANDNGSGVAALLELARLFADAPQPAAIRFVAFVNEEPPFYHTEQMGSVVYAQRAKNRKTPIRAMLSLETIGFFSDAPGSQQYPFPFGLLYPDQGNFIGFVGNVGSRALVREAVASFRRHAAFPSEGLAAPAWITGVGWSDHWAFWEAGYPAIMVTDTALFRYPHYHAASDLPDRLDYPRLARVVMGLAEVVRDLAQAHE